MHIFVPTNALYKHVDMDFIVCFFIVFMVFIMVLMVFIMVLMVFTMVSIVFFIMVFMVGSWEGWKAGKGSQGGGRHLEGVPRRRRTRR